LPSYLFRTSGIAPLSLISDLWLLWNRATAPPPARRTTSPVGRRFFKKPMPLNCLFFFSTPFILPRRLPLTLCECVCGIGRFYSHSTRFFLYLPFSLAPLSSHLVCGNADVFPYNSFRRLSFLLLPHFSFRAFL